MTRPVTLFTGQWADLPLEELCPKAADWGYDGLELACWGDHFDVAQGAEDAGYCQERRELLEAHGLGAWAISKPPGRPGRSGRGGTTATRTSLPPHVWGDGDPDGVRSRAAEEMKRTARAAANMDVEVVNGFTGSPIWPFLYSFPPVSRETIEHGFQEFAELWNPILDVFDEVGVRFALEVHPTGIAFDIVTAERALEAVGYRDTFGFNYDPSHLASQGVDCVAFILRFESRIFHAHMKDVWWSSTPHAVGSVRRAPAVRPPGPVLGLPFPRSRACAFEEIIRALNRVGYQGPLSVEWGGTREWSGSTVPPSVSLRTRSGFPGVGDRLRRGLPTGRLGAPSGATRLPRTPAAPAGGSPISSQSDLEPTQVPVAGLDGSEGPVRTVMFDQEVFHPRVIDVLEEPGPVDDTRTYVRHFAGASAILSRGPRGCARATG